MFSAAITSQYFFMFVLIAGLIALILEIFIPSFGLIGATGIYLTLNAILAMPNVENAQYYLILSILIVLVLGTLLVKFFLKKRENSKIVLNAKIEGSGLAKKTLLEDQKLLGVKGRVIKPLRPSGQADINGKSYQVMSNGEFIGVGETIVVDKIEGNKIYCRRDD